MNLAALPYMTFFVLLQYAAGTMAILLLAQLKGEVSKGFIKMNAILVPLTALPAWWVSSLFVGSSAVDDFPLATDWLVPLRVSILVLSAVSVLYNWFVWREEFERSVVWAWVTAVAGVAALAIAAAYVSVPTFGFPLTLLSLLAGSASLGAVSVGMILGHWYLVTPRLPERPLVRLTFVLLVVLVVQAVLVALGIVLPVRYAPVSVEAPEVSLGQNLIFWLRIGVGLVFPLALAFMAWQASKMRGMMSATGLLYIGMGAVLAGEVLARGLLFTTARPL